MLHLPSRHTGRPVSDIFARRFFSFDTAANGVDGLSERIFAGWLFPSHRTRRTPGPPSLRSNHVAFAAIVVFRRFPIAGVADVGSRFLSAVGVNPVADVGKQLQPTGVAARAPMRSVLMLIPHKGPEFCAQFLRRSKVALVVYHLRRSINCCLNALVRRSKLLHRHAGASQFTVGEAFFVAEGTRCSTVRYLLHVSAITACGTSLRLPSCE